MGSYAKIGYAARVAARIMHRAGCECNQLGAEDCMVCFTGHSYRRVCAAQTSVPAVCQQQEQQTLTLTLQATSQIDRNTGTHTYPLPTK